MLFALLNLNIKTSRYVVFLACVLNIGFEED